MDSAKSSARKQILLLSSPSSSENDDDDLSSKHQDRPASNMPRRALYSLFQGPGAAVSSKQQATRPVQPCCFSNKPPPVVPRERRTTKYRLANRFKGTKAARSPYNITEESRSFKKSETRFKPIDEATKSLNNNKSVFKSSRRVKTPEGTTSGDEAGSMESIDDVSLEEGDEDESSTSGSETGSDSDEGSQDGKEKEEGNAGKTPKKAEKEVEENKGDKDRVEKKQKPSKQSSSGSTSTSSLVKKGREVGVSGSAVEKGGGGGKRKKRRDRAITEEEEEEEEEAKKKMRKSSQQLQKGAAAAGKRADKGKRAALLLEQQHRAVGEKKHQGEEETMRLRKELAKLRKVNKSLVTLVRNFSDQ